MNKINNLLIISVLLLGLSGCIKTSPPSEFFMLSSAEDAQKLPVDGEKLAKARIGVGPIDFPEYLNQPQLVQKISRHQYEIFEFSRWAEPLQDNFERALVDNLSAYLGTSNLYTYPWHESGSVDYQLLIKVVRFECALNESCTLQVSWSLRNSLNKQDLIPIRRDSFLVNPEGEDNQHLVAALSKAVAEFSSTVAQAILRL